MKSGSWERESYMGIQDHLEKLKSCSIINVTAISLAFFPSILLLLNRDGNESP
jgi:hypothetical protein